MKGSVKPCVEYWTERAEEMDTLFGKLAFLASFRDGTSGLYQDATAARDYDAAELSQTLAEMHTAVFRQLVVDAPGAAEPRHGALPSRPKAGRRF